MTKEICLGAEARRFAQIKGFTFHVNHVSTIQPSGFLYLVVKRCSGWPRRHGGIQRGRMG